MPTSPTQVVGRRVAGFLIDLLVVTIAAVLLFYALAEKRRPAPDTNPNFHFIADGDSWAIDGGRAWLYIGLVAAVVLLLAVVVQKAVGGSPGKLVVGLRVVDERGQHAGFGRNAVRLLGWLADGLPWCIVFGLCGFITALNARGNRRVGDMWAGTYVVRASAVGEPIGAATATAPVPTAAPASGVSVPPDWYPDPTGEARLRYWNGVAWTDHTAP